MNDPSRWHRYGIRELTVAHVLKRQAAERGDKVYLRTTEGDALTFAEVYQATRRIGNWLTMHDLGKGSHIAVMMKNGRDCALAHIAIAMIGAVSVPININALGGILAHYLNLSDSIAVVADENFATRIIAIEAELNRTPTLIVVGDPSRLPATRMSVLRFSDSANAADDEIGADVRFSDLAFILFTSGTTGPSKGVMFPQARAFLWDEGIVAELGVNETDTFFVSTPLSHAVGLFSGVWMMMALGATVAISPSFSASRFLDQVRQTGATYATLLGAMLQFLDAVPARADDADNPLRLISAGPYPKAWRDLERRFGAKLVTGYGLSDHSSATKLPPDPPEGKEHSAGRAISAYELMIVDADDIALPAGQVGECVLRARYPWHSSGGYYNAPEQTAHSRRNEWFHTGDRGYLDEDGYFWFVDRMKDMIRRRSENISAFEVEQLAADHPAVADVAAYAVQADEAEDEVAISVVLRQNEEVAPPDLIRHYLTSMPNYMVPRFVHVTDSLPRNLNQRVEKFKLREWAEQNRALLWDRESDEELRTGRPRRP